ncbi:hypothetical protein Cni_G25702 [Canna indica]|uniref:Uncharacterized protein n=1 Tax=Canna indica TaxID=4628 RepID=A0AAQ3KY83_9LILI|nr:hypothetical protein Cni_G25702 [Canna indica]
MKTFCPPTRMEADMSNKSYFVRIPSLNIDSMQHANEEVGAKIAILVPTLHHRMHVVGLDIFPASSYRTAVTKIVGEQRILLMWCPRLIIISIDNKDSPKNCRPPAPY